MIRVIDRVGTATLALVGFGWYAFTGIGSGLLVGLIFLIAFLILTND